MENFNIIYMTQTSKKHSLYSNYGRSLLKKCFPHINQVVLLVFIQTHHLNL